MDLIPVTIKNILPEIGALLTVVVVVVWVLPEDWGLVAMILAAALAGVMMYFFLDKVIIGDDAPPAAEGGGAGVPVCPVNDGSGANNIECRCGTATCGASQLCYASRNHCSGECHPTFPGTAPPTCTGDIMATRSSGALTSCDKINGGNARCHGACDQCVGFDFDLRSWHNCVQDPADEDKCINSPDRCIGPGEHTETSCMDICEGGAPDPRPSEGIDEYTAKSGNTWTAADYVAHRNTGNWGKYDNDVVEATWNNERWHVGAIYTQSGLVSCNDIFVNSGMISGVDDDEEEFTMHQCYGEEGANNADCSKCYGYHPSSGKSTPDGKWYRCENLSVSPDSRRKCTNKAAACRMTGPK